MPVSKKLGALLSVCAIASTTLSACGGGGDSAGSGNNNLTPSNTTSTLPAANTLRIDEGGTAVQGTYNVTITASNTTYRGSSVQVNAATATPTPATTTGFPKLTIYTSKLDPSKFLLEIDANSISGKIDPMRYECKSGAWAEIDLTSVNTCPAGVVYNTSTRQLTIDSATIAGPTNDYQLKISFNAVMVQK